MAMCAGTRTLTAVFVCVILRCVFMTVRASRTWFHSPCFPCRPSFGGCTALAYGFEKRDDPSLKRILCLDAWLFSLEEELVQATSSAGGLRDDMPVLFVDMEFSNMKESIVRRKKLSSGKIDAVTVLGAVHNDSSDFPTFVPRVIASRAGMTRPDSDTDALLGAQAEACCAFLEGKWTDLRAKLQTNSEPVRGLALQD